ncbi:MAG: DNA translocase FtsK, partial [Pseudomonadota bacterium]
MALFWGETTGNTDRAEPVLDAATRPVSPRHPVRTRRPDAMVAGEAAMAGGGDLAAAGLLSDLAARAAGLGALIIGLALFASLVSYNAADPSFLTATGRAPSNWLGAPGAMLADPLVRGLGLGAQALALIVAVWGWRLLMLRGDERIWSRLLAIPVAVGAVAIFASLHLPWESWQITAGLGGLMGDRGAEVLLRTLPAPPLEALPQATIIAGCAAALSLGLALGITLTEVTVFLRWLSLSTGRLLRPALSAAGRGLAQQLAGRQVPRSERLDPPEPVGRARRLAEEDLDDPDHQPMAEPARPSIGASTGHFIRSLSGGLGDAARRALDSGTARAGSLIAAAQDLHAPRLGEAENPSPRHGAEPQFSGLGSAPSGGDPALGAAMRALSEEGDRPDWAQADEIPAPFPDALVMPEAEIDLTPVDPLSEPPVTSPKRGTPKRSRRAEAEAQPSLFDAGLGTDPYEAPALSMLTKPVNVVRPTASQAALAENARMLETVLDDYGVRGEIVAVKPGPVVTLYELEPAPGLKASRVIGLADDIARSMSALSARIATVPGRSVIGIELPNPERETVFLRETLESRPYGDARFPLALALGKDIEGEPVIANLAKMPHLLIAGTTGSGKSVAVNTMILSLLYRLSPQQCRLIMIDPKMLELSVYDNIPHLLAPVVTDPKKAVVALKWVVAEMEERYRRMSKLGVRNIDGYNARCRDAIAKGEAFTRTIQTGFDETTGEPVYETQEFAPEEMPLIVVIVDEMADLMMVAGKEIEACIQRLAQMARASGIHLIMAT